MRQSTFYNFCPEWCGESSFAEQCATRLVVIKKLYVLFKCKIVENLQPKSQNSCTAEIVTMHSEIVDSHCSNSVH